MASLAMSRSLALPWSTANQPPRSSTVIPSSAGMRSFASQSQGLAPVQRDLARLDLPPALRSTSTPLKAIAEVIVDSPYTYQDPLAASCLPLPPAAAKPSDTSMASPHSTRRGGSLLKEASDEPSKQSHYQSEPAQRDLTNAERLSPLSRLSRLWPRETTTSSSRPQLFTPGRIESAPIDSSVSTLRSADTSDTQVSLVGQPKANVKHKPAPLQLAKGASCPASRGTTESDILQERRDSFTFHLPSDLGLDSPSLPPNKIGPSGSAALLHSPQPRRPSLVLAPEHSGLDEPPYTPCWGFEPHTQLNQPQGAATAQKAGPARSDLNQPLYTQPTYHSHTQSVAPTHSNRYGGSAELEAIFRPSTTANEAASAQPHQAGLATVTLSPVHPSETSSANALRPGDLERIAKLHNGRVPSIQQLAPPEHLSPARYDPIVNTGNQGPMVIQAGDWRCGVCNFVNWRRRKICLRCFPYANDIGKVLTIQSQRAAHLATPPAPSTYTSGYPAHSRVASVPIYPPSCEAYQTGVPSIDVIALARSTSYPSTVGLPYRAATTVAPERPYSYIHGIHECDKSQLQQDTSYWKPTAPKTPPRPHRMHSQDSGNFMYSDPRSGISPTSSTPSATSAGEFALRKQQQRALRASTQQSSNSFPPFPYQQYNGHQQAQQQPQPAANLLTAPKGFILTAPPTRPFAPYAGDPGTFA